MAVTISGTQVTFNDGTVQTTEGTLLGSVQTSAYVNVGNRYGYQSASTSEVTNAFAAEFTSPTTSFGLSPSTTVFCGFGWYRSASVNISNMGDSTGDFVDAGTIQLRLYYRSVGTA